MRISAIYAKDVQPTKFIEMHDLSDVVVLAGPNGVGKSRLLNWLVAHFRNLPPNPNQWVQVEATCAEERQSWGKAVLDTRSDQDCELLRRTLHQNRKRSGQKSSLLNFESDRSISDIRPYQFSWDFTDPWQEIIGWDFGLNFLKNRFQDTIHSIFRKRRSQREQIISAVQKAAAEGRNPDINTVLSEFPDPLVPFKDAFYQLLAPKQLADPDEREQQLSFLDGQNKFPIQQLSSGEKEVLNIVFDVLLRNPSDSVIIFDEPELHLHPELSYKLIQTLKNVGARNQFILCTHSADIITASLDNSVVFIAPARSETENQAIKVSEEDETHQALKLIGQSIGVVSLGKKIVLIEGDHGSLDKQTYGAILRSSYPSLVLVPSGGKATIKAFSELTEKVLDRSMWGVNFFMLCDRDAIAAHKDASSIEKNANGRLRLLPRYHLENYFLDERVIAKIFEGLEPDSSPLRDPAKIGEMLKTEARRQVSYAASLIVSSAIRERAGNVDIMPKAANEKNLEEITTAILASATHESTRINAELSGPTLRALISETMARLEQSLDEGTDIWKAEMPGRPILKTFCSRHAKMDFGRLKNAYIKISEDGDASPFREIISIFDDFNKLK